MKQFHSVHSSKSREPLSNLKHNYEVSPFIKQLKSFEDRLRKIKPRLRPLRKTFLRPHEEEEVMKCVNHIISTGTTIDCFRTNEMKSIDECEEDERNRQIEILDKVRGFRVRSSKDDRALQLSCQSRFIMTELTSRESKSTFLQKENLKKPREVSFLKYKKTTKF